MCRESMRSIELRNEGEIREMGCLCLGCVGNSLFWFIIVSFFLFVIFCVLC